MGKSKVIVIVGPTGSGKTGAAIEIAKVVGGEIISADSRAIYKGMDIGTAKPSAAERQGVPHFGLDLVEPGERFTVADFKEYALKCIDEIRVRGRVPIVAGGTGLYVDALVYDYQFVGPTGERAADFEHKNCSDRTEVKDDFVVFGIETEREVLRERLKRRIDLMYTNELFEETRKLVERYGFGSQAMKSNIYQFAWKYLNGEMSLEEAKEQNFYDDWGLARRQMTWFRRNPEIIWLPLEKIVPTVIKYIQDE